MTDLERARAWLDENRNEVEYGYTEDELKSLTLAFAAVRREALEEAIELARGWDMPGYTKQLLTLKNPQSSGGGGEGK